MLTPYYENDHGKLYCGDCLEIMPQLIAEGVKVDAVVTDPPYGILAETGSAATRRSGGNKDDGLMVWDIAPPVSFLEYLR